MPSRDRRQYTEAHYFYAGLHVGPIDRHFFSLKTWIIFTIGVLWPHASFCLFKTHCKLLIRVLIRLEYSN